MDFELDDDVQLLRDNVREFARQSILPHASAWDEARAFDPGLRTALGELGLLGLRLPEARGGTALSMVATFALLEELAVADAAVACTVAHHAVLGLGTLGRAPRVDDDALASLAAGDAWVGWGTDRAGHASARGDAVAVHARAALVYGADAGGPVLIAVGSDPVEVYRFTAGSIPLQPVEPMGLRAAPVSTCALDGLAGGAPVDPGPVLAEGDVAMAAVALGVAGAALRAARDYAVQREQFGRPIAQFQAIQWKVANMATAIDAARLLALQAASALDRGSPRADAEVAAARARLKANAAARMAASESLQIHGGYGYTREFPVERFLRNARVLDALGGGSRAHRSTIAQSVRSRFAEG